MFASEGGLFAGYSPAPLNDVAVPPFAALEADDEEERPAERRDFDIELAQHAWRALPPASAPAEAPVRFVDGSIVSRTVGSITVAGRRRPVIAATIAAAALELEGRTLRRHPAVRRLRLVCVHANDMDPAGLDRDRRLLASLGAALECNEAEEVSDFDSMRRSTRALAMRAMESAEREVMLACADRPTLVDGLLERRLAGGSAYLPVTGLVKRQIVTYLPPPLQELAYSLRPGERTPAFLLRTPQHVDLINCYLRLSSPPGASPSYGIVRLTAPQEYLDRHYPGERLSDFFSGLAGYLYALRHRDYAYPRAGISIEPIVRVEEHLHALRPDIDVFIHKLHRLLKPSASEVSAS